MICSFCGHEKNEKEEFIASAKEPKCYICFKCLGDAMVMIGHHMINAMNKILAAPNPLDEVENANA